MSNRSSGEIFFTETTVPSAAAAASLDVIDLTESSGGSPAETPSWMQTYSAVASHGISALNAAIPPSAASPSFPGGGRSSKRRRGGGKGKSASKTLSPSNNSKKKTCAKNTSTTTVPKDVDAIAVDDDRKPTAGSGSTSNTPDYRQVLGPLRMGFIDTFATAHSTYNVASSHLNLRGQTSASTKTSSTNLQRLYKELVEYQLNLPVDANSAVFVEPPNPISVKYESC